MGNCIGRTDFVDEEIQENPHLLKGIELITAAKREHRKGNLEDALKTYNDGIVCLIESRNNEGHNKERRKAIDEKVHLLKENVKEVKDTLEAERNIKKEFASTSFQKAINLIAMAIEEDTAMNYKIAVDLYQLSIRYFCDAKALFPNENHQKVFNEKISGFKERAHKITKYYESNELPKMEDQSKIHLQAIQLVEMGKVEEEKNNNKRASEIYALAGHYYFMAREKASDVVSRQIFADKARSFDEKSKNLNVTILPST